MTNDYTEVQLARAQHEVLEYVWHSAESFSTRGDFRKSIRHLLTDIADNGAINFDKLLLDLKEGNF